MSAIEKNGPAPSTVCIIGLQWGDEGKGKIVDLLAENVDLVVRFQGGSNAGHTVVIEGDEFILHLLPTGLLRKQTICVLGNGMVIDPVQFAREIDELKEDGVDVSDRLFVSNRAQIVMPYHRLLDIAMEKARGESSIGTTLRGIGPCYLDKVARNGVRAGDLINPKAFRAVLERNLPYVNRLLHKGYDQPEVSIEAVIEEYTPLAKRMKPFVVETAGYLNRAIDEGKSVMFEGAQGSLLDVDFGTYPYVTSSNTSAAAASIGTGVPPRKIQNVLGVLKAYTTRVGAGPFPTELLDKTGETLRSVGKEFGATTGRPRRCGWFDAVITQYTSMISGVTGLAITKLDVLDRFETLQICVAYDLDGQRTGEVPADAESLAACKPVYEEYPGWQTDTSGITEYSQLPDNAKSYIDKLSRLVNVPVEVVSVGKDRRNSIRVT
ncbi:MAG: adenylosuccinate synthase [Planctomycetota bacterium]|nr:adenylosuccinate synthase [Planctomycetota bacterium]MDA1138764.1 adenylosuccinate synthase [Planctomycetota bacterium]